jgi:hypothetical protein
MGSGALSVSRPECSLLLCTPFSGTVLTTARPGRPRGTVILHPTRVGRDANRIADEVIVHLSGLVGARVTVTLEVEAEIPAGAPDHVVRTVAENSRTLKFMSQGFEKEWQRGGRSD